MKYYASLSTAGLLILLAFPVFSFACACCADAGFYSVGTRKPDAYELGELKKLRFSDANLYSTPAYPDDIKGISPLNESYTLGGLLAGSVWKFNFKDDKGKTGTLNIAKPTRMEVFMVDTQDGKDTGVGVQLYKEWRFEARVQSGSGIFQKGIAPATEYFLVLQGRGNACTQAGDFTHWRLEVAGKKAAYVFFGALNSEGNAANSARRNLTVFD